jgi:hypothetical protein
MSASLISNYPNGFSNGVAIRGLPLSVCHPGKVFWVYNGTALLTGQKGGSNGNKGTFNDPFASVAYAITQCAASRGDIIFVKPGHAETFSAADGFDLSTAGVAVVGMGTGTLKPTFTLSATTSDVNISAANCSLMNVAFAPSTSDVVRGIQVTARHATIKGVDVFDAGATNEILTLIKATGTTDNEADGLWVEGCRAFSTSTAVLEFLEFNAHINGLVFKDNIIVNEGTAAGAAIAGATGKNLLNAYIGFNKVSTKATANNLFIDSDSTASTGIAENNLIGHADVTTTHDNGLTGMGFRLFNNLSTSTASVSGFVLPAIDADS